MVIGYARVSTDNQSLDRQLDELKNYGCEKIYTEIASTRYERPKLKQLIDEILRPKDMLVVCELSRLGRSLSDTLTLIQTLNDKQISLKSINESWLDISEQNPMSKMILTIITAFNELARDIQKEAATAGLASARARGVKCGRPKIPQKQIDRAMELYKKSVPTKEISRATGVSVSSIYRYLKRGDQE